LKLARLLCVLMILPAWPAYAHVHLHESMPADGSTLKAPPSQLQLVFSEAARLTALTIRKNGETEARKVAPLPTEVAARFSVNLPPLTPGRYRIEWRALSADHHVASGALSFAVQGSAAP
jgi:methionine-rich copper-binding protein CopC